jgi:preprotein translocase subunit SecY
MYDSDMHAHKIIGIIMALLIIALGIVFLVVYDQTMKVKNELGSTGNSTVDDQLKQVELMSLITGIIAVIIGGVLFLASLGLSLVSYKDGKIGFFQRRTRTSNRRSGRRSRRRSSSRR